MALVSKNFGDIITFTRASTATYFDATGTLQSAAIDAPRFDYDPATLAARGFLIEEARTNLLLRSEDFATTWVKDANSILTVNDGVAPNGLTVADKLAVGTSTFPQIAQSVTSSASSTYTLSCFVKAGGLNFIQIRLRNTATPANFFRAIFDLSTGAISLPANGGTGTYTTGSASFVGNGWWRLSITGVPDTGGGAAIQAVAILTLDANGTVATSSNSAATDGVLFFGAQLEAGAFPTSYIPTTTTALTRSADVASVNTLSPWYNSVEWTLYAEWQRDTTANAAAGGGATVPRVVSLNRAATASDFQIRLFSATGVEAVASGASPQGYAASNWAASTVVKSALRYQVDNFALDTNLGSLAVDTSTAAQPASDQLALGQPRTAAGNGYLSGWLRRVTFYPRALSDAELAAITA